MKNFPTVGLLIVFILIQGCRITPRPSDCPLPQAFVEYPSAAIVVQRNVPSNGWTSNWHWTDGSIAGPTQLLNPGNLDGIAFEARLGDYGGLLELPPVMNIYYLFEFEIPTASCAVSVDWNLAGSVRFPQGLCARSVGGSLIEIGCTDDNFGGRFWIESFSFSTVGMPGIDDGNHALVITSMADARDATQELFLSAETSDPITRILHFDGNYNLPANMYSRIYVGLSLYIISANNAEICTGNSCITTASNLTERAVFSVAEINFEMIRQ